MDFASLTPAGRLLFLGASQGDASKAEAVVSVILGGRSYRQASAEHRIPRSTLAREVGSVKRTLCKVMKTQHVKAAMLIGA